MAPSAGVDWTFLDSLDTWFTYRWEAGELFYWHEGHTKISHKLPIGGKVSFACRTLQACTVSFAVDRRLLMDEARGMGSGLMVLWVWTLV